MWRPNAGSSALPRAHQFRLVLDPIPCSTCRSVKERQGKEFQAASKKKAEDSDDDDDDEDDGGDDADRAADPSALLPLASMMPLRVVGVTIEDDLEEHRMAALEAGRQAAAEEARAAREHKVAEHTRREEETEGAHPPWEGEG